MNNFGFRFLVPDFVLTCVTIEMFSICLCRTQGKDKGVFHHLIFHFRTGKKIAASVFETHAGCIRICIRRNLKFNELAISIEKRH